MPKDIGCPVWYRLDEVRTFVESVRKEEERMRRELEMTASRERASLKIQVKVGHYKNAPILFDKSFCCIFKKSDLITLSSFSDDTKLSATGLTVNN